MTAQTGDPTLKPVEDAAPADEAVPARKKMALVASKGGLDEVYPVLIMASTAGALGWDTQVFCTFYGLDIVNKKRRKNMKVSALGNAASPPPISGVEVRVPAIFGVLPGMNRVATWMMKKWMKDSNIPDVEDLFQICIESGVKFHACATTMGVMNVEQDDILDDVACLGATAFLDFAAGADLALFV
ncbi:MAG: peroxiredoxin family protein [bacterium]|nr:peroxiredoxin family protein [bacterium]